MPFTSLIKCILCFKTQARSSSNIKTISFNSLINKGLYNSSMTSISINAITASGLITGNAGLTIPAGQTAPSP